MDPRHPEQAISRMRELMKQYDRIEADMNKATTSAQLAQLEREGGLVVQEICLVAPRIHEAMMQTSRQRRHDLSRGVVEKPATNHQNSPEKPASEPEKSLEKPVEKSAQSVTEQPAEPTQSVEKNRGRRARFNRKTKKRKNGEKEASKEEASKEKGRQIMIIVDGNRTLIMSPAEYEEWKWITGEKRATWT